MKALKCTPKSKREWEVVLELARALEIGNGFAYIYDSNSSIWNNRGYGPVCPLFNDAHEGAGEELTVPSFIRSMYELAEERKKPKFDFTTIWGTTGYTKWNIGSDLCKDLQNQLRDKNFSDLEKRVKELEAHKYAAINDIQDQRHKVGKLTERLEKLEKIVSEEMGRKYVTEKVNEVAWVEMYMRVRNAMGFDSSTQSAAATTRMTNAYFGK